MTSFSLGTRNPAQNNNKAAGAAVAPARGTLSREEAFTLAMGALILSLSVLLGTGLMGCSSKSYGNTKGQKKGRQKIPVRTQRLRRSSYKKTVTSVASLSAWRQVTLRAEAAGSVRALYGEVGQKVSAGTTLVKIDSATAWRAYKTSKVSIEQARVGLKLARKNLSRMEKLHRTGDISDARYDEAKNGYSKAKTALELAKAQSSQSRQSLSHYRLRAPFSGVLSKRHVEKGDYVSPGAATYTLVEMKRLKVVVGLCPEDARGLKKGQPAQLVLGSLHGDAKAHHRASVHLIRPVADAATRRVEVELLVENPDHTLRPGSVAHVSLPVGKATRRLLIPHDAVVERLGRLFIYVVRQGHAKRVEVETGLKLRDRVEIQPKSRGALRVGEPLVVEGVERLVPDAPVLLAAPKATQVETATQAQND